MRNNLIFLILSNVINKPLGLIRQILFAIFYGVTAIMSACRFAQTITLVFMNFFTADILNAGFLPLFERYKLQSPELAQAFFWFVMLLVTVLASSICILLNVGAPMIVAWFAPGFHGEIAVHTVAFIHIFSYAVPFCLLGTLFSYLAMSAGSVFAVAIRPTYESMGLILGTLLSVYWHESLYIACGFVIAYILFFTHVISLCWKLGLLQLVPLTSFKRYLPQVWHNFWETIHLLLIIPFFMQGKFILEKTLASLMAVSIVAALDYSRFILETGINVLATPIGLLSLSFFSGMAQERMQQNIAILIKSLFIVTIPITLFLTFNSKLIVAILYGYGLFDNRAVLEASTIFTGMAVMFFAQVIGYVLMKILSSQLQNRRMMQYLLLGLFANILFICLTYRSLGSISLGLGESIYAAFIFLLTCKHFSLFPALGECLAALLPFSLLYVLILCLLKSQIMLSKWQAFGLQSLIFLIFWSGVFILQRKMRQNLVELACLK